jgi:F-box and leucine-rich repeat protein GRR1
VQAFLREELLAFCREAPPEFNDHQREVFCVFSGAGVSRLRGFLNSSAQQNEDRETDAFGVHDGTMYRDDEDGDHMIAVTVQAEIMAIDEDEDFANDSEMAGQD